MDLKTVSDIDLLENTKFLAIEERRICIEVIHHLREIDARKLFAEMHYSSLYVYCTEELGYSRGGSHRRIAAMRLLREVPEYESHLQSGAVTVSTLSQVQSFFVQERRQLKKIYPKKEKLKILDQVRGKSTKETERILATLSPQLTPPENKRCINAEQTEIRFTVGKELMAKLKRLKELLGHQSDSRSYAGLIDKLAEIALNKFDPMRKPPSPPLELRSFGRYIPKKMRRAVWHRDIGRCTFVSPDGRRCECRYGLQIEHIRPFAQGGDNGFSNLTLHCQAHNQFAATQAYGLSKMQEFWPK